MEGIWQGLQLLVLAMMLSTAASSSSSSPSPLTASWQNESESTSSGWKITSEYNSTIDDEKGRTTAVTVPSVASFWQYQAMIKWFTGVMVLLAVSSHDQMVHRSHVLLAVSSHDQVVHLCAADYYSSCHSRQHVVGDHPPERDVPQVFDQFHIERPGTGRHADGRHWASPFLDRFPVRH